MNVRQDFTSAETRRVCCPRCRSGLSRNGDALICATCKASYPVVRNIPILLADERSLFSVADYVGADAYAGASYGTDSDKSSGLRRAYRRFTHMLSESAVKEKHLTAEAAVKNVQKENPQAKVLVIGAGEASYADDEFFVYSDVSFGAKTNFIADAHDLPFPDESFDMVIVVAIMEHVVDPVRCAEEIWRVLKPQGKVYAATPFISPVHMGAYDFTRWTYLGHRRLFRMFDVIEAGRALGPSVALGWMVRYWLVSFSDRPFLRKALGLAGLLIAFPIKYCDVLLRNSETAMDAAGGMFFFGTKRDTPVSDREILSQYRGGQK